jgi:hypothetical protein
MNRQGGEARLSCHDEALSREMQAVLSTNVTRPSSDTGQLDRSI